MKRTAAVLVTALAAGTITTALTPAVASAAPGRRDAAIARANANISEHRTTVAGSPEDTYAVRDVILDADGAEHVRYDRRHKGLPVLGGDFVVHDDASGRLSGVSKTQHVAISVRTSPRTTAQQATARATAAFRGVVRGASTPVLIIDARRAAPALAWEVVVTGTTTTGDPSELHVLVDAEDASLRDTYDGIETGKPTRPPSTTPATATGSTLYLGPVSLDVSLASGTYSLNDTTRGGATTSDLLGRTNGAGTLITSTTASFGSGTVADRASAAADAHYGVAETWDYYKQVHGRNGIADDGKGAASRVHYGRSYNNAFWSDSCFCMTFGDGDGQQFNPLVSLDVAGHEMTHGVTSKTARLTYSGESGGLNEATSDVFGTMVEFQANSARDVPDYYIGEAIVPSGQPPLRNMAKPSADGRSADCWYPGVGSLDVHHSSGVGNHAFYLLAQGTKNSSACNSATFAGVGNDAAARIWYRALTVYMTSSTNYSGARAAMQQAATDLYGATSLQLAGVANAWAGVDVA